MSVKSISFLFLFITGVLSSQAVYAQVHDKLIGHYSIEDAIRFEYQDKHDSAILAAKACITAGDSLEDAYRIMGDALLAIGKYKKAAWCFRKQKDMIHASDYHVDWATEGLGVCYYLLSKRKKSVMYLKKSLSSNATQNCLESTRKFVKLIGFDDGVYSNWTSIETKHFIFHFQRKDYPGDLKLYTKRKEWAYDSINKFFKSKLPKKIDYFVWTDEMFALKYLGRILSFSEPEYCVTHTSMRAGLGHEMAHQLYYYAVRGEKRNQLISEGIGRYFEFLYLDEVMLAKDAAQKENIKLSLHDIWKHPQNYNMRVIYPVGAILVKRLIEQFGRDKFMLLLADQRYENAVKIYGPALEMVLGAIETELRE